MSRRAVDAATRQLGSTNAAEALRMRGRGFEDSRLARAYDNVGVIEHLGASVGDRDPASCCLRLRVGPCPRTRVESLPANPLSLWGILGL